MTSDRWDSAGRIVFLGKVSDSEEPTQAELRGFVY